MHAPHKYEQRGNREHQKGTSFIIENFHVLNIPLALSKISGRMMWKKIFVSRREKCPNTEIFLVRIFLYSNWILNSLAFSIIDEKVALNKISFYLLWWKSGSLAKFKVFIFIFLYNKEYIFMYVHIYIYIYTYTYIIMYMDLFVSVFE